TGPHHFQEWARGEVTSVEPPAHALTIRLVQAKAKGEPIRFVWNEQTELFASPDKAAAHGRLAGEAKTLQAGEQVRVLHQMRGQDRLALRVIREGPVGEARKH